MKHNSITLTIPLRPTLSQAELRDFARDLIEHIHETFNDDGSIAVEDITYTVRKTP